MEPREIEAKAKDLRDRLQDLSTKKVGWGMDNLWRQVLQAAYDLVGLVLELAKHAGKPK